MLFDDQLIRRKMTSGMKLVRDFINSCHDPSTSRVIIGDQIGVELKGEIDGNIVYKKYSI